jgi:1,4-alpha-glucan branching enzyme
MDKRFAQLRNLLTLQMTYPGKKLLFMGQEFAQLREWSEERELDWFLLAEPEHQAIQNWYRDLLHLIKRIKQCMRWIQIPQDSSGSMRTTASEAFTVL